MTSVRIPADVEREDRVLAGLTARQLALVAATGVAVWAMASVAVRVLPLPVALGVVSPVGGAGLLLALGRRDGLSGDRFVLAALRHGANPTRRVPAPAGMATVPAWVGSPGLPVAPMPTLAAGASADGVVDLGAEGSLLLCRASAVNFSLRSCAEQQALVAAFGRVLHSLAAPVQVVVRAERADIGPVVADLRAATEDRPPGLQAAMSEHASFLEGLGRRRDVLRREILVAFRDPRPSGEAGDTLARRAEEAASLLLPAGVTLTPLDGGQAAGVLRRCADPAAPALHPEAARPGETIRAGKRP